MSEYEAANSAAMSIIAEWDKHERHIGRILIAAGRGDLWQAVYAAFKSDQELNEPEPGECWQCSKARRCREPR